MRARRSRAAAGMRVRSTGRGRDDPPWAIRGHRPREYRARSGGRASGSGTRPAHATTPAAEHPRPREQRHTEEDGQAEHGERRHASGRDEGRPRGRLDREEVQDRGLAEVRRLGRVRDGARQGERAAGQRERRGGELGRQGVGVVEAAVATRGGDPEGARGRAEAVDDRTGVDLEAELGRVAAARDLAEALRPEAALVEGALVPRRTRSRAAPAPHRSGTKSRLHELPMPREGWTCAPLGSSTRKGGEAERICHAALEGAARARDERRVIGAEHRVGALDEADRGEHVDWVALARVVVQHARAARRRARPQRLDLRAQQRQRRAVAGDALVAGQPGDEQRPEEDVLLDAGSRRPSACAPRCGATGPRGGHARRRSRRRPRPPVRGRRGRAVPSRRPGPRCPSGRRPP